MLVTRAPSPADFPLIGFAVCGFASGAAPKPAIVFHVHAETPQQAVALAQTRPMADGHTLRAERIRASVRGPAGVIYEGPWPW